MTTSSFQPAVLPAIDVSAYYSGYDPLAPIAVTAQKLPMPVSASEWFQPPKVFLLFAAGVGLAYFLTRK